ncbi:hypothetical protein LO772_25270 [Yinghuangia sp. ASG 101]|uniref:LppU/SCO3897 family protein n=1 Tax=Yinghuangia sp. ASG 101 TaxID=2896848 RepID=UPI001E603671|nr:hypothetical protein [Yinghuangia sp. ASG 101]UGQ10166.1 hypothetical protein LO772_25270 [Yinghuangia sp. ASG 101]
MSSVRPASRTRVCAVAIGVTVMLAGLVACGDDNDKSGAPPMPPIPTAIPSLPSLTVPPPTVLLPTGLDTDFDLPTTPATRRSTVTRTPTVEATTPTAKTSGFSTGECLAGEIAGDGSRQDELTEVSCSDADAAFKVLRTFPYRIGSDPCADVSGTEYSYDEYMTLNGVPTGTGTTYCLRTI